MDLNKIMLIGRLGKDPETKSVGGKTVASFSLATSYGTGENPKTQWHQINAWEKLAEIAQKVLHVGDRVYVEGRIDYTTSGEGDERRYFTKIVATNLINLSNKREENGTTTIPTSTSAVGATTVESEDVPF